MGDPPPPVENAATPEAPTLLAYREILIPPGTASLNPAGTYGAYGTPRYVTVGEFRATDR